MTERFWSICAAAMALAGSALAGERLTEEGARLAPRTYSEAAPFEVVVDAAGDAVLEAHVILRPTSSNRALARDLDGFWAPWDGDVATLPASAAIRDGAALRFKLFAAPPPDLTPPLTVTIAYRTPEGLRFGWFDATPEPRP
jgi:hypothetical protein